MPQVYKWLLLAILCGSSSASRILVFYPGPSGSLLRSFTHLFQELASRGHELTVVTAYDLPALHGYNITQVVGGPPFNDKFLQMKTIPLVSFLYYVLIGAVGDCDAMLNHPKVIEIINSNVTYDLFIGSPLYFFECSIAVAHHMRLPILNIYSNRIPVHFSHLAGQLYPLSYVAELNLPFSNTMTFWQRTVNTFFCMGYSLYLSVSHIPQMEAVVKKHFPELPPLKEMLSEIQVTLLNTNIAVHPAQPLLPGLIPVGGLTIPQNTKLPEELQVWMDSATEGVVLFSLGSNIKMTTLDHEVIRVALSVFGRLRQRVLMKWEGGQLPDKPDNVRLAKWIPQAAILAHPHCRLFITHGGLHSWMEAVYFSVPLLGVMPSFFDQKHNLAEMEEQGHGLQLSGPWTEDNLHSAINKILHNPQYKENIQKASQVFKDQPLSPLQTAVYWTEYVIKHRGARHLQSSANAMTWNHWLLDITAAFAFGCVIFILLMRAVFKCVWRFLHNYQPKSQAVS